jgi:tetratricopeptide (TPR) repeat protein
MAPEQTERDAKNVGPWTDVYLLGATLYFILTGGSYPHAGNSAISVMRRAMVGDVEPPSSRAPHRHVPPELEEIARRALDPEPANRHASAEEFVEALQAYLTGASRRMESEKTAAEGAAIFESLRGAKAEGTLAPREAYARHREVADKAARALEHWPRNEEARALRALNLASRLESEIENGDLTLAEVHLQDLRALAAESPLAEIDVVGLSRRYEEAAKSRRTQRRQRVALAWAAGVMLALHGVGMTYTVVSQLRAGRKIQREKEIAEANMQIARGQGEGAYDLVNFVLRDLKGALDDELTTATALTEGERNAIKHAIAGRVARPISAYFSDLDTEHWPAELLAKHAERMGDVSLSLIDLGRIEDAEAFASRALRLHSRSGGARSIGAAEVRLKRSHALRMLDRYDEARAELESAIAAFEDSGTRETLHELAGARNELGKLDLTVRHFEPAEKNFRQALALIDEQGKSMSADDAALRADLLSNLAAVCLDTAREREALDLARESVETFELAAAGASTGLANALDLLARCHAAMGDDAAAVALFERALNEMEAALGPSHPFVATQLSNLGACLRRMGRLEEAEASFLRAMEVLRGAGMAESLDFAYLTLNYTGVTTAHGDYAKTLELCRDSAAMFERILGPDDPRVGIALAGVGRSLREIGNPDEALLYYRKSLASLFVDGEPTSISAAGVSYDTARLLHDAGEAEEAEALYRVALRAYDQNFLDLPGQRNVRFWLGLLLVSENRPDEAVPLLERSVEISEKRYGALGRPTLHARFRLAQAHSFAGRPEAGRETVVALARAGYARIVGGGAKGDFEALLAELSLDAEGDPLPPPEAAPEAGAEGAEKPASEGE